MVANSDESRRAGENIQDISVSRFGRISNGSGKLLGEITIKPRNQGRMLLGSYAASDALRGFSIQLQPQPDPEDAVVTQISNAGTTQQYKLLLHIMNYGTKTVTATVWQL